MKGRRVISTILFVILILGLGGSYFLIFGLYVEDEDITTSEILPYANLDFQNETGIARIDSTFTNLLIMSEGSSKKGDGYEVYLGIINPSSITLKGISCEFKYSGYNEPARYNDVNLTLEPGKSTTITCFISNLSDLDLKSIRVNIDFDMISYYR